MIIHYSYKFIYLLMFVTANYKIHKHISLWMKLGLSNGVRKFCRYLNIFVKKYYSIMVVFLYYLDLYSVLLTCTPSYICVDSVLLKCILSYLSIFRPIEVYSIRYLRICCPIGVYSVLLTCCPSYWRIFCPIDVYSVLLVYMLSYWRLFR